jgi:DNA helicase-2/ATP-dependent DNA helicase PcrA
MMRWKAMNGLELLGLPPISDDDIRRVPQLLDLPKDAFFGEDGKDPRRDVLRLMDSMDVAACPGSGKTTLLVAKLAILADKWRHRTRGICVLSHTNSARDQIETRLGKTSVGRYLLSYPHFIGTIHAFVDEFLALPWLRSLGYPVTMINTEVCQQKRWCKLSKGTRKFLEKKLKDTDGSSIRITDTSFDVAKRKGPFPFDRTDWKYKEISRACRQATKEGYYCYDDMFIWARDAINRVPWLIGVIRDRFPLLFIDETQDNSEVQSDILHRIFMKGDHSVVRQRFGDANQAVFDFVGATGAMTDEFPNDAVKKELPNSYRFGQRIAGLADPLGLVPCDLKGHGPSETLVSGRAEGPHTLFVFDEGIIDGVLDAYAELLIQTFSEEALSRGVFTAVGQIHEAKRDDPKPCHVGHYWPAYDPKSGGAEPRPSTLAQYVLLGQDRAKAAGETRLAVETIAGGLLRAARLLRPESTSHRRTYRHRYVLDLLGEHGEVLEEYRNLMMSFVVRQEVPTKEVWGSHWGSVAQRIAEAVAGIAVSAASAEARRFLEWPSGAGAPPPPQALPNVRGNIYKYPEDKPKVSIRLGSIHSVKGQTHTATLVLETFWNKHNLECIKDWLCGGRAGLKGKPSRNQTRLKIHYVAMTRPTHLLCLAMERRSFKGANKQLDGDLVRRFEDHGWQVKEI